MDLRAEAGEFPRRKAALDGDCPIGLDMGLCGAGLQVGGGEGHLAALAAGGGHQLDVEALQVEGHAVFLPQHDIIVGEGSVVALLLPDFILKGNAGLIRVGGRLLYLFL